MKIYTRDIIKFLNSKQIEFLLRGNPKEKYEVASMFNIVENGFYFFTSNNIPSNIRESLILTNQDLNSSYNSILQIKEDPQYIYYRLINFLFKEKSNGNIKPTSIIHDEAILGENIQIDDYCIIGKVKIGDNSIIKSHCVIEDNTTIGNNTIIESHSHIGARGMAWVWNNNQTEKIILPQLGGVKIGNNCILGSNTIVVRGSLNENTIIGNCSILAPGCRLGHGTKIGNYVHLANNVATGGNTVIGDYSFIGSSATFRPKVVLHNNTIVGTGAVVINNTSKSNLTLVGVPAKEINTKDKPAGMPKPKK